MLLLCVSLTKALFNVINWIFAKGGRVSSSAPILQGEIPPGSRISVPLISGDFSWDMDHFVNTSLKGGEQKQA